MSRVVHVLFVTLGSLLLAGSAQATERPLASQGGAQFLNDTDFVGSGHMTHLGRYTEAGSVTITPGDRGRLRVEGGMVYTAADGDELHAVVVGEIDQGTGAVTARIRYIGGTGRFTDASGTASLTGQMLGRGALAVAVEGTLDY